ncbi:MAG TPA: PPOX class F420-dependent oxidoreductase [Terriglobales bacterium]|nr:PPOX class F420-dependent oxidoreductase [Terriglobales bacterium]
MGKGVTEQFANQNYLSIESYRKDGAGVRTPVWFAEEAPGTFYVYTTDDAWKVKRIRNNPHVKIAPCDMRGTLKGAWVDAQAAIVEGSTAEKAQRLLSRKYFWKRVGDVFSRLMGHKQVVIAIQV